MNHDSRSFEDDLSSLKADVAVIRSNYATKADLHEVRIELKAETQAVKAELKADIRALNEKIDILGRALNEKNDVLGITVEGIRTELHKSISAQTWKLVGFASALVVAAHFASRAGY